MIYVLMYSFFSWRYWHSGLSHCGGEVPSSCISKWSPCNIMMSEKHSLQGSSGDPHYGPPESQRNQCDASVGMSTVPDICDKYVMNFYLLSRNIYLPIASSNTKERLPTHLPEGTQSTTSYHDQARNLRNAESSRWTAWSSLSTYPTSMYCPYCHTQGVTKIEFQIGNRAK